MRVSRRIIPVGLIFLLFGGLLSFLVFYSFRQMEKTTQKLITSRRVAENSFNLSYLAQDYSISPTARIRFQWDITQVRLEGELKQLKKWELDPYSKKLVEKISEGVESARQYFYFSIFVSDERSTDKFTALDQEELGQIISADLHETVSLAFTLESIFREEFLGVQRRIGFLFLVITVLFFLVFFGFVYRLFREITYRDQSQKKLEKANEKLRLVDRLVEFTGDGVYRYSYKEGKILYANQGFIDIMELSCAPSEVVGKRLDEVFSYFEEPGTIRSLTKEKEGVRSHPYCFKTLGGKKKWILYNSFLVKGKKGEDILEAIVTDVTAKRKADQKNEFLAGMLDNAPISVIATDKRRKIIYVNPATEKLFGYSQEELIGKDPIIFNAESDKEEIENEILEVLEKEKMYTKRLLNRKKGGQIFTVETSIYQLKDNKGEFVALVGFQKDVTREIEVQREIKDSEVKFRTIFEKAGNAIFVADPENGKIIDCNRQAEKLIGASRKELIGLDRLKLHPKEEAEKYKKMFSDAVDKKKVKSHHAEVQDKEGNIKPVLISAQFFNFGGRELLVGFFTDLSVRLELEEKEKRAIKESTRAETEHAKAKEVQRAYDDLRKTQDKLVATEKLAALGKLSGIVAHDLRNPLAVIRNSVYILRKNFSNVKDPKIIKYFELLNEEIEVADNIIEEVLSFTRVKNLKVSVFDLNKVINSVLEKINIPGSIRLIKDFGQDAVEMKGDKEQLQRLFTNLFRNGIEAIEGEGVLGVKTMLEEEVVLIEISDTGIGIEQKDLGRIFEPMYSSKIHGTGLGLPACKNIIDAHRGHISVKSLKGKGTVVLVALPLDASQEKPA